MRTNECRYLSVESAPRIVSFYFVIAVVTLFIATQEKPGNCENSCVSPDLILTKNSKSYVAKGACQPIFPQDDSRTMVLGKTGTAFTAENNSITLEPGKILVFAAKRQINVTAKGFQVRVHSNSICNIQLLPSGILRLENFCGSNAVVVFYVADKPITLKATAGEEICIIKLDDEYPGDSDDLIPVDGVDREPIVRSVMPPGCKVAKSKFDQRMMIEREELLYCARLRSKRARQIIQFLTRGN